MAKKDRVRILGEVSIEKAEQLVQVIDKLDITRKEFIEMAIDHYYKEVVEQERTY